MSRGSSTTEAPERSTTATGILDASVRLLREGGVAALTSDAVATGARVSKSTIYKTFGSMTGVLAATLGHLDWRPVIHEVGDLATELDEYQADRSRFFAQRGVRRVVAAVLEASASEKTVRLANVQHVEQQLAVPTGIFRRAQERGEIGSSPSAETLVTVLCGAVFYRVVVEGQRLDEGFTDELTEIILRATEGTGRATTRGPTER